MESKLPLPTNYPLSVDVVHSTAASVASGVAGVMRAPFRGTILKAGTMIGSTVASADATVTLKVNSSTVTGGSWTITQSGSAIGDHDYAEPTGANTVNDDDLIQFDFSGSGTGGGHVYCYAVIKRN